MESKTSVLFVCLGNICRSPLAEGIFTAIVAEHGLQNSFKIDSCGTGDWHISKPPHQDCCRVAKKNGISIEHLRARQFSSSDYRKFDLIVAMDEQNLSDIKDDLPTKCRAKLSLLREYDDRGDDLNVPDPYYEGNFQGVYDIIERCCRAFFADLHKGSK